MSHELGMRGGRLLMALAAAFAASFTAVAAPEAEYAVRWKSTQGGPATLDKTAELLQVDGAPTKYSIRYFSRNEAAGAASAVPILRERQSKKKTDFTWKYRSAVGWSDLPGGAWCPLVGETKKKDEIDVTVQEGDAIRRVYSRSCTARTTFAAALPPALVGPQRGCTATMTRRESADNADESVTIEAWKLAGEEGVFLEVSRRGADTSVALAAFRREVVDKLLAAGARPLDRSKTELGTECK